MRRVFIVLITLLVLVSGQQVLERFTSHVGLGPQINLLTGRNLDHQNGGCFTNHLDGLLTVDETYGTKLTIVDGHRTFPPMTIMWPVGYTGFRVGSEIAIVDEHGNVVGMTGNRYAIWMGGDIGSGDRIDPPVPGVELASGSPTLLPSASPSI
jgi:hypothetical protein